jgi:hypothetical protein
MKKSVYQQLSPNSLVMSGTMHHSPDQGAAVVKVRRFVPTEPDDPIRIGEHEQWAVWTLKGLLKERFFGSRKVCWHVASKDRQDTLAVGEKKFTNFDHRALNLLRPNLAYLGRRDNNQLSVS